MKFDVAVFDQLQRLGDVRIFEKPLEAQARLDGFVGAFAEADGVFVGLFLFKQAAFLEHFGGAFAGFEAVDDREVRRLRGRRDLNFSRVA